MYTLPEDDSISPTEYTAGSFSAFIDRIFEDQGLIIFRSKYAVFTFVGQAIGPVKELRPGIITFAYANIHAVPEDFSKPLQVFVAREEKIE